MRGAAYRESINSAESSANNRMRGTVMYRKTLPLFFLLAAMLFSLGSLSLAAQWVPSPVLSAGLSGASYAGGGCCAWVDLVGVDHMLFFDIWSGSWTELILPGTHSYVTTLGTGNLIIVITQDLVVAFNGPPQSVHVQPLTGDILDTGTLRPSYACSEQIAVVTTDEAFYVFDARMDQWRILDYEYPTGYSTHEGTVAESDYVVTGIGAHDPYHAINLAYSLRRHAFAQTDLGVANILGNGFSEQCINHGFAGRSQTVPDHGVGYSAFTNQFSLVTPPAGSTASMGGGVVRKRRELCHLWGACATENIGFPDYRYYLWVYDTITGGWTYHTYDYDYQQGGFDNSVRCGGGFVSFTYQDSYIDGSNTIGLYSGESHTVDLYEPGLYGQVGGYPFGGRVAGFVGDATWGGPDDMLWIRSMEHPLGQTVAVNENYMNQFAGENWLSWGDGRQDMPLMDLHFYHGPTNSITSVETWYHNSTQNHDGTHLHCLTTTGDDVDVIFYSAHLNSVARRDFPLGTMPSWYVNDNLALVFHNGVGDCLYDARTGMVHERAIDYSSLSLGSEVCVGFDTATNEAHGYSGVTGQWYTVSAGSNSTCRAGGMVGVCQWLGGSRYYGFSALDGSWTELIPTGSPHGYQVGEHTAIVQSPDRVWAYWPYDTTPVQEDEQHRLALAHALQQVRCHPNPFNGRTLVAFDLPGPAEVKVEVFDLRGRRVAVLLEERRQTGEVAVAWQTGRVPSGIYIARLQADNQVVTRKITLVQ